MDCLHLSEPLELLLLARLAEHTEARGGKRNTDQGDVEHNVEEGEQNLKEGARNKEGGKHDTQRRELLHPQRQNRNPEAAAQSCRCYPRSLSCIHD